MDGKAAIQIGGTTPFAMTATGRIAMAIFRKDMTTIISIMTKLEFKGDWNIAKGKLKQKWAKLTDDDLQNAESRSDEIFGRIQKRTGENLEMVEKYVKELFADCG